MATLLFYPLPRQDDLYAPSCIQGLSFPIPKVE